MAGNKLRVRRPSMADVAQVAGVSHQTVSRVLNDPATVKEETRARVLAAMSTMGYQRNMAARALARSASELIGIVSTGESRFGATHAIHAVEEAARQVGYMSTHVAATSVAEIENVMGHLLAAGTDGIVVIAPTRQQAADIISHWSAAPVVLVAASAPTREGVSVVAVDQELGARLAVRHLASLGHRRIHHISGPLAWFDAATRVAGWRSECEILGIEAGREIEGGWDAVDGHAGMNRLLDEDPGLTAVFCANDLLALGALRALWLRGRKVPEDVSVVGFDDMEGADFFAPPLTTVKPPFADVGRLAITVLLDMIASQSDSVSTLDPHLVVRQSTAPRRPDER